jgi:predicted acyltransferase
MPRPPGRILSVDVLRGIVMLLLLPDVYGGMHRQFPDNPIWAALARAFTHVQWSGATAWDMIMPSFVFVVGVAMPLSAAARLQHGESRQDIFSHMCFRSAALFLLGRLVTMPQDSYYDEIWPIMILFAGVPLPQRVWTMMRVTSATA